MDIHRISNTSTLNHQRVDNPNQAGSTVASASTSLAQNLQENSPHGLLIIQSVICSIPESAPEFLRTFAKELAPEHGLSGLYRAVQNNDAAQLPSPEFLLRDLIHTCKVQLTKNNSTLIKPLKNIVETFLTPASEMSDEYFANEAAQMACLFGTSHVLIDNLNREIDSSGNLYELGLDKLNVLNSFCIKLRNTTPVNNELHAKLNSVLAQMDKNLAIATVIQNPMELEHLAPNYRGDVDVVLAAVRVNGLAIRHAHSNLHTHNDIAFTAIRQNPTAYMYFDHVNPSLLGLLRAPEAPPAEQVFQPAPPRHARLTGNVALADMLDDILNMDL